jgi:hypothetical protein
MNKLVLGLTALSLLGCGSNTTLDIVQQNKSVTELAKIAVSKYFTNDVSSILDSTPIWFSSSRIDITGDCSSNEPAWFLPIYSLRKKPEETISCYTKTKYIVIFQYLPILDKCTNLIQQLTYAVEDQLFHNTNLNSTVYAKYANEYCAEHIGEIE